MPAIHFIKGKKRKKASKFKRIDNDFRFFFSKAKLQNLKTNQIKPIPSPQKSKVIGNFFFLVTDSVINGRVTTTASPVADDNRRRRRGQGAVELGRVDSARGNRASTPPSQATSSVLPGSLLGPHGGSQVQVQRLLLDLWEEPLQRRRARCRRFG